MQNSNLQPENLLKSNTNNKINAAVQKSTAEKKQLLRNSCKVKIAELPLEYNKYASEKICTRIINMLEYKRAKTVFCFVGTQFEIDTQIILQKVLIDKKILCVPLCTDNDNRIMQARQIQSFTQLKTGAFNIKEPIQNTLEIKKENIDVAILPCLTADKNGVRLGYGGGYYDRFFYKTDNNTLKIAICRQKLISDENTIPINEFDVFADIVVTEDNIYLKSKE